MSIKTTLRDFFRGFSNSDRESMLEKLTNNDQEAAGKATLLTTKEYKAFKAYLKKSPRNTKWDSYAGSKKD